MQANIAQAANGPLSRLQDFRELAVGVPDDIPIVELAELYTAIENVMGSQHCPLLQLVGTGANCLPIALDLAWAGAAALGKRVLLLNCASAASRLLPLQWEGAGPSSGDRMIKIAGHEVYIAEISGNSAEVRAGRAGELALSCFDTYRPFLDLAILVAPPAERDPLGVLMARHVDANILVVEAEGTHRAEAVQAREILLRAGRPLLGAILNNRRNYLPDWLARHL